MVKYPLLDVNKEQLATTQPRTPKD